MQVDPPVHPNCVGPKSMRLWIEFPETWENFKFMEGLLAKLKKKRYRILIWQNNWKPTKHHVGKVGWYFELIKK